MIPSCNMASDTNTLVLSKIMMPVPYIPVCYPSLQMYKVFGGGGKEIVPEINFGTIFMEG